MADFGAGGELVLRLSPAVAVLCSASLSLIFVCSLHLWRLLGFKDPNRDFAGTIQRRFISGFLTCLGSAALLYILSGTAAGEEERRARGLTVADFFGFAPTSWLRPVGQALALTAVLFAGPVVQHLTDVLEGSGILFGSGDDFWVAARNLAVAPFTEEFVFRTCVVRLWVSAGIPDRYTIFLSPFFFALAHTHHFVEHVRKGRDTGAALMQVAFQVFYTSLFGTYCNFLLLRMGSTPAIILTHSFCNLQGFPDVGFLVQEAHPLARHKAWLGAVYLLGMVSFGSLLFPLTRGCESSFVQPA